MQMSLKFNVVPRKYIVRYSWGRKTENHFSSISVLAESGEVALQKAENILRLQFENPALYEVCDVTEATINE